jgi:hypothetical protein
LGISVNFFVSPVADMKWDRVSKITLIQGEPTLLIGKAINYFELVIYFGRILFGFFALPDINRTIKSTTSNNAAIPPTVQVHGNEDGLENSAVM